MPQHQTTAFLTSILLKRTPAALLAVSLLSLLSPVRAPADAPAQTAASLTIEMDKPGVKISPDLYGIFFEEINHAGDGGLYAEMIQNRSFEDADRPLGWSLVTAPGVLATLTPAANETNARLGHGGGGFRLRKRPWGKPQGL